MDVKTKRTLLKASVNFVKIVMLCIVFFAYMLGSMWVSFKLFDNVGFGIAAIGIPFLIYAVWDHAKMAVEREIEKEESLIRTLSKNHER